MVGRGGEEKQAGKQLKERMLQQAGMKMGGAASSGARVGEGSHGSPGQEILRG